MLNLVPHRKFLSILFLIEQVSNQYNAFSAFLNSFIFLTRIIRNISTIVHIIITIQFLSIQCRFWFKCTFKLILTHIELSV